MKIIAKPSITVKMTETDEFKQMYEEIDKLATFLIKEYPEEPGKIGKNESSVDVAIRLLQRNIEDVNIVDDNNVLVASVGKGDVILQKGYRISQDEVININ